MFHGMCDQVTFLSETSVTNFAIEGFFIRVNHQMLLKIKPFGIDEESANGATLVIGPMVIHMQFEVIEVVQQAMALYAL